MSVRFIEEMRFRPRRHAGKGQAEKRIRPVRQRLSFFGLLPFSIPVYDLWYFHLVPKTRTLLKFGKHYAAGRLAAGQVKHAMKSRNHRLMFQEQEAALHFFAVLRVIYIAVCFFSITPDFLEVKGIGLN